MFHHPPVEEGWHLSQPSHRTTRTTLALCGSYDGPMGFCPVQNPSLVSPFFVPSFAVFDPGFDPMLPGLTHDHLFLLRIVRRLVQADPSTPSLHPHYKGFSTTMSRSDPVHEGLGIPLSPLHPAKTKVSVRQSLVVPYEGLHQGSFHLRRTGCRQDSR
ncbi:hypothetical protein [Pasteuria penetrans]|uniref:hypothetical protein n=1 Tax=Pasteuria penetrans TaxID=86005 RepID=UPI0011EE0581|nr:hypothetical protein [Pasteuria penetrans]